MPKQYGIETLTIHESKQQGNKILSETAFCQSLTASAVFISQIYTSSSHSDPIHVYFSLLIAIFI